MMMNLQAILMVLCTLFLTIDSTMGAPYLRSLSEEAVVNHHLDKSPICRNVGVGMYKVEMVKHERVSHFVEHNGAVAGRCGPEHCEHLCMVVEKAVSYHSHGNGNACDCKFE